MPIAKSSFYKTTAKINSIIMNQTINSFVVTIPKTDTDSFVAGQLVAFDATSNKLVEFTATYDEEKLWTYTTPFAGFIQYEAGAGTDTAFVITRGILREDALLFADVRLNDLSGLSTFTVDDFVAMDGIVANVQNPYSYQGVKALNLISTEGDK
tara:strand:+ start:129 stop:590 length:462 start_codon:yes stop_codon:yes gene_type:complete